MFARTTMTKSTAIAVICATALFAGACGSDASSSSEPSEGASVSAAITASPNAQESPLGDLLGIPFTDNDAMDVYFNDLSAQAEVKIATCMAAQGFDYKPVDYSGLAGGATDVDVDSREFATAYGFGIASNPFGESFEAFEKLEDPNQAVLAALTNGEREAYQTALNGELPDFDASTELDTFEPGGCQGDAFDEVYAFGRVFDQFANEFDEIEEAFNADPRIVKATAGWSTCMTEAGYRFTDEDGAEADLQRRYDAIVRDPNAFAEGDVEGRELEADGDEEVFVIGPQNLNPKFQARVDALAVEERAVATASWDCNAPLREISDDIQIEYERRFVEENGAAISAALSE